MERKKNVIHNLPAPHRWWHAITHHVQGMHFVHDGLVALSRNGRPTGEILFAGCVGGRWMWNVDRIESDESHVGGIDGYGDILAVPSYDDRRDPTGGFLTLYRLEDDFWTQTFRTRLPYRPYAVGIAPLGAYNILAVVVCPRGSEVRWFCVHRTSPKSLVPFGRDSHFARGGARNNIAFTIPDGEGLLYSLRAGFRYDTIKKYRVDFSEACSLRLKAVARAKNGLCGVRWGATIDSDSGEEILHTTARNAFGGRLHTTAQRLRWESVR